MRSGLEFRQFKTDEEKRKNFILEHPELKLIPDSYRVPLSAIHSVEGGSVVYDIFLAPFSVLHSISSANLFIAIYFALTLFAVGLTCLATYLWSSRQRKRRIDEKNLALTELEMESQHYESLLESADKSLTKIKADIEKINGKDRNSVRMFGLVAELAPQINGSPKVYPQFLNPKRKRSCAVKAAGEGAAFSMTLFLTFCVNTYSVLPVLFSGNNAINLLTGPIGWGVTAGFLLLVGVALMYSVHRGHERKAMLKQHTEILDYNNGLLFHKLGAKQREASSLQLAFAVQNPPADSAQP